MLFAISSSLGTLSSRRDASRPTSTVKLRISHPDQYTPAIAGDENNLQRKVQLLAFWGQKELVLCVPDKRVNAYLYPASRSAPST